MLCLTCTTISSVALAHYGVSRAKDWVSVDCGTRRMVSVDCGTRRMVFTKDEVFPKIACIYSEKLFTRH